MLNLIYKLYVNENYGKNENQLSINSISNDVITIDDLAKVTFEFLS